jgi:NitT/TauT family transport system substrate-binding protein
MKQIKIGHLSTIYHTNFIMMQNNNFKNDFQKELNWTLFGTGPAMVQAFKKGNLDIGYMGLPPAIIGIDNGVPIKCVAGGHIEGTIMIGKKKYKKIDQLNYNVQKVLSQFIGKTIGVPSRGSIHDVIIKYYLGKFNLLDKVEIKNYKQSEYIALDMKKGILDGGVGTPALAVFASTVLNSKLIIKPEFLWPYNPSYGIFFHNTLIKNFPNLIKTFLRYHKEASYLLRTSQSIAAEKISKVFKIVSKDYVEAILKISPKYCISLSKNYTNSTMEFVKALHALGYIKRVLSFDDIFVTKFVERIHPEQDHY